MDLPKCAYEDSNCFTRIANEAISKGKLANNDLGLGVFDPLKVKMFSIDQNTGQVQLKIEMENFEFRGISAIKFNKVVGFRKNFEKAKIELKFNFPEISMQGT